MICPKIDIMSCVFSDGFKLFSRKFPLCRSWRTDNKDAIFKLFSLSDKRASSHNTVLSNDCAIEEGCAHSDEGIRGHSCPVNYRSVPYGYSVSEINRIPCVGMNYTVVLYVCPSSYSDRRSFCS